jgi:hypothetical protein
MTHAIIPIPRRLWQKDYEFKSSLDCITRLCLKAKPNKNVKKLGIDGMHINIINATCDKARTNIILKGEKLKVFSYNIRNKTSPP